MISARRFPMVKFGLHLIIEIDDEQLTELMHGAPVDIPLHGQSVTNVIATTDRLPQDLVRIRLQSSWDTKAIQYENLF